MPVRKIPKNHLCVTGGFASRKNGLMGSFESLLEKEFMLLLDFDDNVIGFAEQPVTIPLAGVPKGYTPDVLVRFRVDPDTGFARPPLLTEIKHSDDLKKNAEKYAPKFAAAELYAGERGWQFVLTTEKEIRTVRLSNLKFLREYRNIVPLAQDCNRVLELISKTNDSLSLSNILERLAFNEDDQMYWLPIVWHMVCMRQLSMNLDLPIGRDVVLGLAEDTR